MAPIAYVMSRSLETSQIFRHLDHDACGSIGGDMRIAADLFVPVGKIEWFSRDRGTELNCLKPGVARRRLTKVEQKSSNAAANPRRVRVHGSNSRSIDRRIAIGVVAP